MCGCKRHGDHRAACTCNCESCNVDQCGREHLPPPGDWTLVDTSRPALILVDNGEARVVTDRDTAASFDDLLPIERAVLEARLNAIADEIGCAPSEAGRAARALAEEIDADADDFAARNPDPESAAFRALVYGLLGSCSRRCRALLDSPDTEPASSDDTEPALQTQSCASTGCQQAGYIKSEQWGAYLCGSHAVTGPEPAQQDDWERHLHHKFRVERTYPSRRGIDHSGCRYFVLDPQHDLIARQALGFYAQHADRFGCSELAADLRAWLDGIDPTETPFPSSDDTEPLGGMTITEWYEVLGAAGSPPPAAATNLRAVLERICKRLVTDARTEPAQPAAEPGDVDALAEVLLSSWAMQSMLTPPFDTDRDDARKDARAVLASDWLARHDAEVAARAWDEATELADSVIVSWSAVPGLHPTEPEPHPAAIAAAGARRTLVVLRSRMVEALSDRAAALRQSAPRGDEDGGRAAEEADQ